MWKQRHRKVKRRAQGPTTNRNGRNPNLDTTACALNHFPIWPSIEHEIKTRCPEEAREIQAGYVPPTPGPWHVLLPLPEIPFLSFLYNQLLFTPRTLTSLPRGHLLCSPQTIRIHLQTLAASCTCPLGHVSYCDYILAASLCFPHSPSRAVLRPRMLQKKQTHQYPSVPHTMPAHSRYSINIW